MDRRVLEGLVRSLGWRTVWDILFEDDFWVLRDEMKMSCRNCGKAIEPGSITNLIHVDTKSVWCSVGINSFAEVQ